MHEGRPSSGLLIIDKPRGVTSHDVVAAAHKALGMKRVGHAGTLDPMATGVLVVGFGHATRLLNYVVAHDKSYEATIRLGQATTTDDATGEFLGRGEDLATRSRQAQSTGEAQLTDAAQPSDMTRSADTLTPAEVKQTIAKHFLGNIEQVPSAYSAIKVAGRRAYDLAREGRQVELKARMITVSEFTVIASRHLPGPAKSNGAYAGDPPDAVMDVDVRVTCSAGTYIRSLARDLGGYLGVGGHLTRLRRTRVGAFAITDQHLVPARQETRETTTRQGERVARNAAVFECKPEELFSRSLSMREAAQQCMPTMPISDEQARDLRFGRRIRREANEPTAVYVPGTDDVVGVIQTVRPGEAKPLVVFPPG